MLSLRRLRPAFVLLMNLFILVSITKIKADVIMVDQNNGPSIVEDDEFDDVILMPGANSMFIGEDVML